MSLAHMPPYQELEQQPPHNLDAEQALLGAILMSPREALPIARTIVNPTDFFDAVHERVFDVMLDFDKQGRAVSITLLASALRDDPEIVEGVTVAAYLATLAKSATTVINVADYARTVRDLSVARTTLNVADALADSMRGNGALQPYEAISEAVAACDGLLAQKDLAGGVQINLAGAIREALSAAEARREAGGEPEIATGLQDIDCKIGGLWRGQLVILAGRPGMGKSAFMEALQISTARSGHGSVAFSYEMGHDEFGFRAASLFASGHYSADRLEYSEFRRGVFSQRHGELVLDAAEAAARLPVEIVSASGMTVHDIASRARRIAADMERRGKRLSLIFIDYLQLVTPSRRYAGQRTQEVGEITTALKALAQQMGVCIVLLSQLSRNVETRDDKRPRLSDLRESGNIEQDADVVLFLYREAYYLQAKSDPSPEEMERLDRVRNEIEVIVSKQRHGATGIVKVFGDLATGVFRDMEVRR